MAPPPSRSRGHLGRGALYSLLLHAALVAPICAVAFVWGGREEAQRAEEVDVGFESVPDDQLPPSLPPLEPPSQDALDKLAPDTTKTPKPKKPKPVELAKQETKKPEPEVVAPPMPPMPQPEQPPPPPPQDVEHRKSVELGDENDKVSPDAKYLAEKNNKVAEETRATHTNLEKNTQGATESASAPSERKDEQVGGAKDVVRQLADEKSAAGRMAPKATPRLTPELASPEDARREKSLLALRDPAPRAHEITPETADPSLPHAADGELAESRQTARGAPSRADKAKGKRVKLALTGSDFEYMFGADAEAERRLAKKLKSTTAGRFRERSARVQSSLENFIPEVRPGNQTALNTRAAPFAVFIARMHRSIHALWGFDQLEDWDELPSTSPLNNPNLMTTLEIVLNADGTVDKITMVRSSGYMPYDAAVIDTAFTAGPYPEPPREIRSANGKIYVHWNFHRDARQCSPAYVDYYILNNPPTEVDKAALAKIEANAESGVAPAGPRRLTREHDDAAHREKMRALDAEVASAEHHAGLSEGEGEPEAPSEAREAAPIAETRDPEARAAGARFFAALAAGDVGTLAGLAEVPFRTTGGAVVKTREALRPMLTDLVSELGRKGLGKVQVLSGAGVRAAFGRLPPGLEDGSGLLVYAVSTLREGDALIAALSPRPGGNGYRIVALVRR